jgi:hypothetical protein
MDTQDQQPNQTGLNQPKPEQQNPGLNPNLNINQPSSTTPPPVTPLSSPSPLPSAFTPPQTPPPAVAPSQPIVSSDHAGSGKLIFIIVFVLILLASIGGYLLYTLSQQPKEPFSDLIPVPTVPVQVSPTETLSASESAIQQLENVSDSDEIGALEEDIENSDFSTLDEDVSNLEQEL